MKITDPKLLHELYEIEAERKLLIGYRFKGCLSPRNGVSHISAQRRSPADGKPKRRSRVAH